MIYSYFDLNFGVIKKTRNYKYADGNVIRLVNLGPNVLFSNYKLKTSIEKHLEDISHAHLVFLLYKLKTSARSSDCMYIGFDRYRRKKHQKELATNKNMRG